MNKKKIWVGRILSGLAIAFLFLDAVMKIIKPAFVVEATVKLGYPESTIVGIGVVLMLCTILYAIPQTSLLGAVLLMGYLGGAVATNLRVGAPLFTNILFPVYFGAIVWAGLYLRDARARPFLGVPAI